MELLCILRGGHQWIEAGTVWSDQARTLRFYRCERCGMASL